MPVASPPGLGKFAFVVVLTLGMFAPSKVQGADPIFLVRTPGGQEFRRPLGELTNSWRLALGKPGNRVLASGEWLSVRRVGMSLPALPSDEHLLLGNGDRIPFRKLRMDDEKLRFHHPDLDGNKPVSVGLSSVAMIWRLAPEGTVDATRVRHAYRVSPRKRDQIILLNSDKLEGTLNSLSGENVEVEVTRKIVTTKIQQVAAILFNSDLTEKFAPRQTHARVVVAATETSPGGRFTVTSAQCDGATFTATTTFGATLRVALERILSLEVASPTLASLTDLAGNYEYTPYLDEKLLWSSGSTIRGGDLTLGGSTYDRGLSLPVGGRITYKLDGKWSRFDTLVGLDDRDGRKGHVRLRILLDGKPGVLSQSEWKHSDGATRINLDVSGIKEMTLELTAPKSPVQGVVNFVEARLVR